MIETLENPVTTDIDLANRSGFTAEPATLRELFLRSAAEFNLPDALNYKQEGAWKKISSVQMVERAANIALGLYSLGLRKGDRVAILEANSHVLTLADAGCQFGR